MKSHAVSKVKTRTDTLDPAIVFEAVAILGKWFSQYSFLMTEKLVLKAAFMYNLYFQVTVFML